TPARRLYTPPRPVASVFDSGAAAHSLVIDDWGRKESLTRPRRSVADGAPSRGPLASHVAAGSTRIGGQRGHERVRARAGFLPGAGGRGQRRVHPTLGGPPARGGRGGTGLPGGARARGGGGPAQGAAARDRRRVHRRGAAPPRRQ